MARDTIRMGETGRMGKAGSRWMWFAGLWAAGATATALAAYGLRWVLLGL